VGRCRGNVYESYRREARRLPMNDELKKRVEEAVGKLERSATRYYYADPKYREGKSFSEFFTPILTELVEPIINKDRGDVCEICGFDPNEEDAEFVTRTDDGHSICWACINTSEKDKINLLINNENASLRSELADIKERLSSKSALVIQKESTISRLEAELAEAKGKLEKIINFIESDSWLSQGGEYALKKVVFITGGKE
jgi:hypothetical protein